MGRNSPSVGYATNACTHTNKRIHVRDGNVLHLFVEFLDQLCPVLQADFEDFPVVNLTYSDEIKVCMSKEIPVG